MDTHHKPAFEKIAPEKRRRILDAAVAEFAARGLAQANINVIARNAGVSIGAMYNYFAAKEDLLLTVVDGGYTLVAEVLERVEQDGGTVLETVERVLRAAVAYARRYPELHQIYLDMTSESMAPLSRRLSGAMETVSARFYRRLLEGARERGEVAADLDVGTAAFCLDNLVMMLQFAHTSHYFRERLGIFVGTAADVDEEALIAGILRFAARGLGAEAPPGDNRGR